MKSDHRALELELLEIWIAIPGTHGQVTGKDVLQEDVRQLCILENTLQARRIPFLDL